MVSCFKFYSIILYKNAMSWDNEYNILFLSFIFIVTISSFILIFLLLVNRRLKYFKYIINSVKKIDSLKYLSQLEEKGNDEFTELAQNINIMNKRLQDTFMKEKEIEDSKYELITSVSHDLKTPLTSIIGYSDLLNKHGYEDELTRDEYISIVYNKSLRLKDLVNELFEYTKLTGNDVKLDLKRFNVSALINQIAGESIIDFNEKDVELVLINPYKELYSNIDVKLISRVFENIIKNAEKYSISHSTFKIIVESSEEYIEIHFMNKCKDIEEIEINKVFEKFYRLDSARSSEKEGSGLGLTISKKIIELHHGILEAGKQGDNLVFNIRLDRI
ncbi:integral membrane sensor signal transduction histidine kinase [Lachnoclostridium phytofermentans ISDg]|uniref:histidine kinase n=2 Tax=Lachnoclostridium phytofermentans TaxID=66219 RepID=A9KM03_LACP7|nr:integral membrane sensor signal transduction histidine kinase [Lachnoclostridium phytofermentans ISDg]